MLLRRLEVFFVILLAVTVVFHGFKYTDWYSRLNHERQRNDITHQKHENPVAKPIPFYKTPLLLGYGSIKGRGQFHRTQIQVVGRRRRRGRKDQWDSDN